MICTTCTIDIHEPMHAEYVIFGNVEHVHCALHFSAGVV